jgi:hypothetical protein
MSMKWVGCHPNHNLTNATSEKLSESPTTAYVAGDHQVGVASS